MKHFLVTMSLLLAGCTTATAPRLPIASGQYTFQHRFAEHPTLPSLSLNASIDGTHIVLTNPKAFGPFPAGILAEGELTWHAASSQWIISQDDNDRMAQDVGGCSDGPEIIDLVGRIYWTC